MIKDNVIKLLIKYVSTKTALIGERSGNIREDYIKLYNEFIDFCQDNDIDFVELLPLIPYSVTEAWEDSINA